MVLLRGSGRGRHQSLGYITKQGEQILEGGGMEESFYFRNVLF